MVLLLLSLLLFCGFQSRVDAQYSDQQQCQQESFSGCIFLGDSSWDDVSPWPCHNKTCPFHLKPLPGDCVPGKKTWVTKGNTSASPWNEVLTQTIVSEALKKDMFPILITPNSPDWTDFQVGGRDNQYWMTSDQGMLMTPTPDGTSTVGYNLPGSGAGFVVSSNWLAAAAATGDTCTYYAISNSGDPNSKLLTATLPKPADADFWPYAANGQYIYAVLENTTAGPLQVFRWDPSGPAEFQFYFTFEGDKECQSPPAGDWSVVVEGSLVGILFYTSAEGGYPCVADMAKPGSAKALFKFDPDAQETATFQMGSAGDVVYQTSASIWYVTYNPDVTFRDLKYEIEYATTYAMLPNDTSHYPTGGPYFWRNQWLVYQGNGGHWAYEFLAPGNPPYNVLPVVLDFSNPNDAPCGQPPIGLQYGGRTYLWRNPQIAANGTIFFLTLESTDGATGATGHIWGVNSPLFVSSSSCSPSCVDQGNGGHGTCAAGQCWCNTGCSGTGCETCTGPQ